MYPERKVKLIFSTSAGKEKEEKRILEVLLEPLYLLKFYSRLYWPWAIYMCVVEISLLLWQYVLYLKEPVLLPLPPRTFF